MSKIDTAKTLLGLAKKNPGSYARAAKYAVRYGLVGLRDRFHEEIVMDDVALPSEGLEPGSSTGGICFSIVMPVYNVDIKWLDSAIRSIEAQTYDNWEVCIADDASTDSRVREYLQGKQSEKIKVVYLEANQGISGATNAAASLAKGDFIALMDNDDVIHPGALADLFVAATVEHADLIYTDNDVVDEDGNRLAVLHKPDWSPDLMLSQMYVGHLVAFSRALFESVGGFRSEFDGSQDYDLFLRMSAAAEHIFHVSKPLYSWRAIASSTASNPDAKPYSQIAGQKAIQNYLDGLYGKDECRVDETDNLFVYDVRYPVAAGTLASIVIPTKDHADDLKVAIDSIFAKTEYPSFEIIVLDNNSSDAETFAYFDTVVSEHDNVRVVTSAYPFNWSKLNNQGISEAKGDVLIFLNNDVEVLEGSWLTRLVENALRPEIGVAGALLTYPDGTIQHAGVVVGMGGWADHVYKAMPAVHNGNPFISPMVTRNVSAVTGACMAISRSCLEEIGLFDEDFIVCGSDVELCLRALKYGKRNVYLPGVRLTHYESKTRDAKDIPAIDFKLSEAMYRPYVAAGDPYYNSNLDYMSCVPRVLSNKERLQRSAGARMEVSIPEIRPLHFVKAESERRRLNLLVPSVNPEDIFGGIATALKFYERLLAETGMDGRIIVLDAVTRAGSVSERFDGYELYELGSEGDAHFSIVNASSRNAADIPVARGDWFIATSWWSSYCYQSEYGVHFSRGDLEMNPLIYLVQDYEPGFYAWSSNYLLARSTYTSSTPVVAVFNSSELRQYFFERGFRFDSEFSFDPMLNDKLKEMLIQLDGRVAKRRQILVYGRPGTPRNAFELVVESLREFVEACPESSLWEFLSAGEQHPPVPVSNGRYLVSVGKQSLEGYASLLAESDAGISLMASPHPSYPPLEMASFGVKVITNTFVGKDLASFGDSVVSVSNATPHRIGCELARICEGYSAEVSCGCVDARYLSDEDLFPFLTDMVELLGL